MLDNDNIMTAEAFEVVQKIPTDEKDDRKCSRLDANKAHPALLKETFPFLSVSYDYAHTRHPTFLSTGYNLDLTIESFYFFRTSVRYNRRR